MHDSGFWLIDIVETMFQICGDAYEIFVSNARDAIGFAMTQEFRLGEDQIRFRGPAEIAATVAYDDFQWADGTGAQDFAFA